jgi:uncharacterized membrane protein YbaN (DUF454 family)
MSPEHLAVTADTLARLLTIGLLDVIPWVPVLLLHAWCHARWSKRR